MNRRIDVQILGDLRILKHFAHTQQQIRELKKNGNTKDIEPI